MVYFFCYACATTVTVARTPWPVMLSNASTEVEVSCVLVDRTSFPQTDTSTFVVADLCLRALYAFR